MDKLVSIVLPVYNGERFLAESIDSVIAQTYQNWELIIIDDCSSDSSPEIAKRYAEHDSRIRYYRNEHNLKLPKSLNRGFSLSKGDYLSWTSDDNLYLPEAIEKMVLSLKSEIADFVFASCDLIDENGNVFETYLVPNASECKSRILGGNIVGACFMYTRKVYMQVGEYNTERFLVEDYDYWLRIISQFKVTSISDVLYLYRQHSASLTSTKKKEIIRKVYLDVLLSNYPSFGKLKIIDKYYLYKNLYNLSKNLHSGVVIGFIRYIPFKSYYVAFYRVPQFVKKWKLKQQDRAYK